MKYLLMLGLALLLQSVVFANQALDDLHALLHKKEKVITPGIALKQKNLSQDYYFVFIYKGGCPHCKKLSPILKDFATHFNVNTLAYRFDNEDLPEFKADPLTPALFQTFYLSGGYNPTVPALFLVNRHTLTAYAVLFGEAKDYELANRVSELLEHIEERFHD